MHIQPFYNSCLPHAAWLCAHLFPFIDIGIIRGQTLFVLLSESFDGLFGYIFGTWGGAFLVIIAPDFNELLGRVIDRMSQFVNLLRGIL